METISVLMSVYKEPQCYVEKALNSILSQTFRNFEFIIVVDAPDNIEMISYLQKRAAEDRRLQIIVNEENIGLAMSLNKAINTAKGSYFARMDADDIAMKNRFEEELTYLKQKNLDMVACAVDRIDEDDQLCGDIRPFSVRPKDINSILPYQNIIVHPTVLMRADRVRTLGGYRNFYSCQDYDLWLRFVTSGYQIGMLDKKLLSFRRHKNSISVTRRFSQILNERYIQSLYCERLKKKGCDSFSDENLERFLVEQGFRNKDIFERENLHLIQYRQGIQNIRQQKFLVGVWQCIFGILSKNVRYEVKTKLQVKIKKKALIRKG